MNIKLFNKYHFYARYLPGFVSIIPLLFLYFYLIKKFNSFDLSEYFKSIQFAIGISATFIFTYLISMLVREMGSFLEEKYFGQKAGFPSTYLMLFKNSKYPKQSKIKYGEKLNTDFHLVRLNESKENNDLPEAIKILNQASRLISTKFQQDAQVKEANIAYGFARNVSGGLFISLPVAVVGIIVGLILNDKVLVFWSCIAFVIYLTIALLHKKWIVRNAEKYAEKLITTYMQD